MENLADKIKQLKEQLKLEISKENSNNNLILQLTNEIAKLDENEVRFTVDAGIINRLGKELVGRHETAVSELVKNAYDADSLEVKLIFEHAFQPKGTLYIEDDGVGMTREQLIKGFMRLSSADKIHTPLSPRFKRIRAGRKGIGRFATQRLGEKLTIITQTVDSESAIKVEIDWNKFQSDMDLLTVSNSIQVVPKQKQEGTLLIIKDLREGWTDAMIKRVFRYTSDLLQPFPLSKSRKKEEKKRTDPGFRSTYFRNDDSELKRITDDEDAFFNHALADIEGYVLDDGQACWSLKSNKLNFKEEVFFIGKNREDETSKFEYIKGVHFKAYYFIYLSSLIPNQQLSFIRDVANEKGGIRLYRNGFRVLPYAETGNDWLRLDESSRRRIILAPHSNNNFFGFVEITDKTGVLYEETSSREGLIENTAFNELVDFLNRTLVSAVIKVAELRGTKSTTTQKDWKKEEDPTDVVDSAISELDIIIDEEDQKKTEEGNEQFEDSDTHERKSSQRLKDAVKKIKEGRDKEKEKIKNLLEEKSMLRVLAGLGLVIGEFVHEVKRFLPAFHTDTTYLKEIVKDYPEALTRTERLSNNLKSFTTYTSYFDNTISQNVLRELEVIELRDVVYLFEEVIKTDSIRSYINFLPAKFGDFDLFTTPMHKSEWASILFNLYTNSKKAIRRAEKKPGEIFVRCGRENTSVFMCFSDNGDGIPIENRSRVFDAFFTTTSAASLSSSDTDAMSGTGLGLKIVKDIVESYGGSIVVTEPDQGYSTTVKILIPSKEHTQS